MNDKDKRTVAKIVAYCERIDAILEKFERNFDAFLTDVAFQDACCWNVIRIGALVVRLSAEQKEGWATVPWAQILAASDYLTRDYDAVDAESVWQTVTQDVPALRRVLLEILSEK